MIRLHVSDPRSMKACQYYGRIFNPNGPRQEYCDNTDCQAARKKNCQDCDGRKWKKAEEAKMKEQLIDLAAYRIWKSWPEERRQLYLNNAWCYTCRQAGVSEVASFAPGYVIRKGSMGLVVEGCCAVCGEKIARVCD